MNSLFAGFTFLLASMVAVGNEDKFYMPFPEAQITALQWEAYRGQVIDVYCASLHKFPSENLEVMHSPDQVLHFAFTTPGHPVHPAWITRRDESSQPLGHLFQRSVRVPIRMMANYSFKPTPPAWLSSRC